jgi:TonB family protein
MAFQPKDYSFKRFAPFLGLAVLIHLASVPLFDLIPDSSGVSVDRSRPIEVTLVPSQRQAQRHAKRPKKKLKVVPKKEKEPIPKGQIVSLPSTPDTEEPENAKYLAKTNAKTKRETKSRHRTTQYKNAGNEVSRKDRSKKDQKQMVRTNTPVEIRTPKGTNSGKAQKNQQAGKFELPSMAMRDALTLELDPNLGNLANRRSRERLNGEGRAFRLSTGSGEQSGNGKDDKTSESSGTKMPDLIPSMSVLASLDAAPASDLLKDVEEGEGTFLNAKRFKYASFFNRVHKGVSNVWEPLKEYRRRDPNGQVYGRATRVTVLSVTLNASGDLTQVGVAQTSGIKFLDQEAIAAFRRAQPFPNPPRGLLENEMINFNFGFSLVLSPRGPFEPRY